MDYDSQGRDISRPYTAKLPITYGLRFAGTRYIASVHGQATHHIRLYALLRRFTHSPIRLFWIISIAVLVLYAFGPIAAAQAPYMEGAVAFNSATVLATELMHLVSGTFIIGLLTQRALRNINA